MYLSLTVSIQLDEEEIKKNLKKQCSRRAKRAKECARQMHLCCNKLLTVVICLLPRTYATQRFFYELKFAILQVRRENFFSTEGNSLKKCSQQYFEVRNPMTRSEYLDPLYDVCVSALSTFQVQRCAT